jgi:hypothetical protein
MNAKLAPLQALHMRDRAQIKNMKRMFRHHAPSHAPDAIFFIPVCFSKLI